MRYVVFLAAALAGCSALPNTSGVVDAEPEPFPHPGIYTAPMSNGVLTYQIEADGTGKTCFRDNYNEGRMRFGDLVYDGEYFHTSDGSWQIEALSADRIQASYSFIDADMRRKENAPSQCRDFFG